MEAENATNKNYDDDDSNNKIRTKSREFNLVFVSS